MKRNARKRWGISVFLVMACLGAIGLLGYRASPPRTSFAFLQGISPMPGQPPPLYPFPLTTESQGVTYVCFRATYVIKRDFSEFLSVADRELRQKGFSSEGMGKSVSGYSWATFSRESLPDNTTFAIDRVGIGKGIAYHTQRPEAASSQKTQKAADWVRVVVYLWVPQSPFEDILSRGREWFSERFGSVGVGKGMPSPWNTLSRSSEWNRSLTPGVPASV